MRVQQKYQISQKQLDSLPVKIKRLQGAFIRSVFAKDRILQPDTRAFNSRYVDRFSLQTQVKGLFFRVREESDLQSGTGKQYASLIAYRFQEFCTIDDHIDMYLLSGEHKLSDVLRLFGLLGLDKVIDVTKKRDELQLVYHDFSFKIHLDQVEGLNNCFVEFVSHIDQSDLEDWLESIRQLCEEFGILPTKYLSKPYYQLLLK